MRYLILLILAFPVMASGNHQPNITNEYITQEYTEIINKYEAVKCNGASGIAASQLHFSHSTTKLQGGFGYGTIGDCKAGVLGLGKVYKNMLFNGTIGVEGDETSYGIGGNWKF